MDDFLNNIYNICEQEADMLEAFNSISAEKTKLLKTDDINKLDGITRFEEAMLMKIAIITRKKQDALAAFARNRNIGGRITFKDITEHLPVEETLKFAKLSGKITELFRKQDTHRYENEKLVHIRLGMIENVLKAYEFRDKAAALDTRV